MRKHKTVIFLTIGFLVGISILLYPAISDFWNSKTQSRAIVDYESVLENMSTEDYEGLFAEAHAYNKALYETDFPLTDYGEVEGYYDTLSVTENGMLGYLKIDCIGVELPIYHGTSNEVLNKGVGHLEGSSLPVGGENTHCVMSAHRGLPSSKLFTDLDRVEIGDTFQIIVLDQVLTYQVEFIKIIEPNDVADLQIIEGGDYCTLFTCTPYGINTHRLLVRGVRIETIQEKPVLYVSNEAFRIEPLLVTPAVAAPMLLVLLIHLLVKYREVVAHSLLLDVQNVIEENTNESDALPEVSTEMATVTVGGYECIGILSVPVLDLELPVLTDWSYAKLKKAPCHYYGTYHEKNFVIAAHNYSSHFGRLSELQTGDLVLFTDVNGIAHAYEVVLLETLPKEATEEMIAGGFDLSLYTCTTGGGGRVTVRCNAVA